MTMLPTNDHPVFVAISASSPEVVDVLITVKSKANPFETSGNPESILVAVGSVNVVVVAPPLLTFIIRASMSDAVNVVEVVSAVGVPCAK